MKKSLTKLLSLACVFALLLTMAIPAMATEPDLSTLATTGVSKLLAANIGADVLIEKDSNNTDYKVYNIGTSEAPVYGTFLKRDNGVVFRAIDTEILYKITSTVWTVEETPGADGAPSTYKWKKGAETNSYVKTLPTEVAAKEDNAAATATDKGFTSVVVEKTGEPAAPVEYEVFKTNAEGKYVFNTANTTGVVTLSDDSATYIFGADGQLQVGANGEYISARDALGIDKLYKFSHAVEAADVAATKLTNPAAFKVVDASADVADEVYVAADGVVSTVGPDGKFAPIEGKFFYKKADQTGFAKEYNASTAPDEGYQKDGKAFAGIIVTPASVDSNGNTIPATVDVYTFADGNPYSQKVTVAGNDPLTIYTTYDAEDDTKGGPVTYLVSSGEIIFEGDANPEDETATYPIKTVGTGESQKRYILNEDGSVRANSLATQEGVDLSDKVYGSNVFGSDNLLNVDGEKFDVYEDVEVEIDGVVQRYCLKEDGTVLANGYRRLIDADGADLGVAYYTSDGITYAGWVEGEAGARKYQTVYEGRYFLVTGLQFIPAGVDPADPETEIAEGFYLFNAIGDKVTDAKVSMNGHTFTLDENGVVETIDGEAPTLDDIFTL